MVVQMRHHSTHNSDANTDDGSCVAVVEGCMDETALNYNVDANIDDGSCFQAITQENIHSAVDLWVSNQTSAESTYGHISNWDVSGVNNMSSLFNNNLVNGANLFNDDIGDWNESNVTDMNQMFNNAHNFNQDISSWDVSNVSDMQSHV